MAERINIVVVHGEHGERGLRQPYSGKPTARALRARLTRERAGGDRWSWLEIEGEHVPYGNVASALLRTQAVLRLPEVWR